MEDLKDGFVTRVLAGSLQKVALEHRGLPPSPAALVNFIRPYSSPKTSKNPQTLDPKALNRLIIIPKPDLELQTLHGSFRHDKTEPRPRLSTILVIRTCKSGIPNCKNILMLRALHDAYRSLVAPLVKHRNTLIALCPCLQEHSASFSGVFGLGVKGLGFRGLGV